MYPRDYIPRLLVMTRYSTPPPPPSCLANDCVQGTEDWDLKITLNAENYCGDSLSEVVISGTILRGAVWVFHNFRDFVDKTLHLQRR